MFESPFMVDGTLSVEERDLQFGKEAFERIATDMRMIVDREVFVGEFRVERLEHRVAGEGTVHISFRQAYVAGGKAYHGCLLVPLPDAQTLAAYLMMVPDQEVEERRAAEDLDRVTKDAVLELGNFVAAALDSVVRQETGGVVGVRPEGCQGVRADVRPAIEYEEGTPLVVCRAAAQLGSFERFEALLMVPVLDSYREV